MVAAALFALGLLFVLIGWFTLRSIEQAALDPETLCPKSGPISILAILVDRTDGLTDIQGAALEKLLLHRAQQVPKFGALRIYEVGKGGNLLEPRLSVCNPGDGSEESTIDARPEKLREDYEEKFERPIRAMIRAMLLDEEAETSPILEAVQAISVRDFGPDAPAGHRELLIISDLLQHGEQLSFYSGVPEVEAFRRSSYGRSVAASFERVYVVIYLLNRPDAAAKQSDALGLFWIRWMEGQGAITEFRIIPG